MKKIAALAVTAAAIATAPWHAAAQEAPAYHLVKSIALGAPDHWDLITLDAASHRLYVAHGDRVTVVDAAASTVIGEVEGIPGGTHGIAISPATGHGYTDDGEAGIAVAFDLKTRKKTGTIKAADDADAIVADPVTGHVFVINGDSGTVTVIDPTTDASVATIDAGGKLELGVADDHGKLYINGASKKEIVRIDAATNKVDAHWPIPDCTSPHGIAIDVAAHRLFSSCVNSLLTVVNTDTGAVVASAPIGKGTDGAAFDPKRKLVFSSNGADGTLSVIAEKDANTFVPVATIKTAVTGKTMAIDPDTGRLYIAAAEVDSTASPVKGRPKVKPGSLKLLVFEPVK